MINRSAQNKFNLFVNKCFNWEGAAARTIEVYSTAAMARVGVQTNQLHGLQELHELDRETSLPCPVSVPVRRGEALDRGTIRI